MPTIFLFGPNGMLGRYVHTHLKQFYPVIAISREQFSIGHDSVDNLDAIFRMACENDVVVNCAGVIPQKCTNTRELMAVNAIFPVELSYFCCSKKLQLIHISTDCVFSGEKGQYYENDIHDADTVYGISKSLGEKQTMCVIRTSIIGEELFGKKSLLEWVKSQNGGSINGYSNHYWNGVTCLQLAKIIRQIIHCGSFWKGVRHVYSPCDVSKHDLIKKIIASYDLNVNLRNVSMGNDSNKTLRSHHKMGFEIPDIEVQIDEQRDFVLCT